MIALFRLLARVPLPLMQALGRLLGWLVWWLAPAYRRRFRAHAVGAGLTPAQYRPAIGAAGQMVAELPWLWARPRQHSVLPKVLRWEGEAAFEAALAQRQGVILATPHLGSWELCGQAVGERFGRVYGPITALFRPARKKWMAQLMTGARERPGLRTLPTTAQGVRALVRTLRDGGYIGLLPDQVPAQGQGVWAPFLGRPAYTMTLLARLARSTGARVFLVVCERLPHGRGYVMRFEPLASEALYDPQSSLEVAVTAMNAAIETLIRALPGQYVWDYARYKQPRSEPAEQQR